MNDNEIKVSQLIEATDLNENDLFMIVQNGVNKKLTGNKIGGNEIVISTTEDDITAKTKLFINSLTKEAKFRDGNNWETLAGDEVLVSTTQPTDTDNKLWVDTNGTLPYVNSEVNIGATNVSNTPVWFKQSKNLLNESALVTGGINESTGEDIANATRKRTGFINAKASTKYTLSITAPAVLWLIFYYYNENFTFISSRAQASQTSVTDTAPANTNYLRVVIGNTATEVASNIMLNEGETALPYEPYVDTSIVVDDTTIYKKPEMTYGKGTINSNYIGSAERNYYYKNGNLVCFACTCTANATWTGSAEIISGLPKPIGNLNFIGFNSNQALPIRFQLTTNGVLRKYFSNNGVVNNDVVDIYITYFTTD